MTDRSLTQDREQRQAACAHYFPYDANGVVGACEHCDLPHAATQQDHAARTAGQPDPSLREQLAEAIRHDLKTRTIPPFEAYPGAPYTGGMGLTEWDIADAALAVVQPLLDAKQAEADALRADRDALLNQPVLRLCTYPACLRQFDLSGQPARPEWSSTGWLQVRAVDGYVCPDHAATVQTHAPHWLATGKFLACACGWESPPVRWRGYGAEAWKDHLLPEVGTT